MGKLKSAWEIAQEKADRLGKLSLAEMQRQREQECRQIGRAIAQRYLDSPELLPLAIELNKYQEKKDLVRQATLTHLTQAIDLRFLTSFGMTSKLERIIQGIATVEPKSESIIERIRGLAQEYEQLADKTRRAIEIKCRETLHQLRISGTAVGNINIEATPQWQQSWQLLTEPLESRLDSLKQELINSISSV
ncbi:MAG: hypothetical protein COS87_00550 [Chloroflexi bacterium CG07_land_8_20_14_0_80_45_17]|nr:MAG: hypothetical protein COS87_00550 [Chloroflexi bacterium CG07_land_8_20_14_0_80_45_17]